MKGLILLILSLFLIIIALLVVIVVNLKKISVSRKFNREINEGVEEAQDEGEDEEEGLINIPMPSSIKESLMHDDNHKMDDKIEVIENVNEELIEDDKDSTIDEVIEVIEDKVEEKENHLSDKNVSTNKNMQEVVNLLIDKKNYVLLANGNQVEKGEHLKIRVLNKIYYATVIKGNYMKDISSFNVKPKKLIIIARNLKMDVKEFTPKKKKKVSNEN